MGFREDLEKLLAREEPEATGDFAQELDALLAAPSPAPGIPETRAEPIVAPEPPPDIPSPAKLAAPAAAPAPETTFLEDLQNIITTGAGRVAKTIEKTLEHTGLGFSDDTEAKLAPLVGKDAPPLFRTFNRAVLEGPVEILDLGMAAFQGGLEAVAVIAEEFGVDHTTTRQLIRDVNGMVIQSMSRGGVARPERGVAPAKLIERAVAKLPKAQKEPARAALKEAVDPLEGLHNAIAAPGFREVADKTSLAVSDRALTNIFDRLLPLKRVGEELGDVVPYEEMRLLSGTREVIRSVLEHGTIKWSKTGDIVFNGEGLHAILNPIFPKADQFAAYAVARRSAELTRRGKETLVTKPEIKAGIALGKENPEFRVAFEAYQRYNNRVLDFAEQSGLINKKGRKAIAEANMNYVPYFRIDMKTKPKLGRKITGRKEQLRDVFENMVLNTAMITEASLKNSAKQLVYEQLDKAGQIGKEGSGAPIERLGAQEQLVKLIDKDLAPRLKEIGVDADAQLFRALSFRRNLGPNTDGIMIDGKWKFFKVNDKYLLDAVNAYEPTAFPTAVRMIGAFPKLLLTRMVTMDPGFIAFNTIRDTQTAYVNTRGGFIPAISSIRGLANRFLRDDIYWEAMANGMGISTLFKSEVETARGMREFYKGHGLDYRTVLDTPKKIERAIEDVTSAFELAARLEEFRLVKNREGALKDLPAGERGRRTAALAGREVSVDFGKMGASKTMQFFVTTAPFFNAGMQGVLRLGEVAAAHPTRTAVKGAAALTIPSLMLYRENKDQEWYRQLPDWVKDLHWPVKIPGTEKLFLIPKGFEYGAIFATIPERMMEGVEQQYGSRFANKLLDVLATQLRLDPTPQVLKIAKEQLTNKTFTGAPIIPQNLLNVHPSEQTRPWTSETLVEMATFLKEDAGIEMSPMRTEALVRQIFGTLGGYILEGVDSASRAITGKEPPTQRIDEVPVLKRFFRQLPLRQTQMEIDFFELLHATRITTGTYAKVIKEMRKPALEGTQERKLFALRKSVETVARISSGLTKQLNRVLLSDLSPDEKAKERDKIYAARNKLFDSYMSAVPEDVLREEGLQLPVVEPIAALEPAKLEVKTPTLPPKDQDLLVRTVFGEAEGETALGRQAVAHVALNRAKQQGKPVGEVVMAPRQFDGLTGKTRGKRAQSIKRTSAGYKEAAKAVDAALAAEVDPTKGSTHFHHVNITPRWAEGKTPTIIIGKHAFYNNID